MTLTPEQISDLGGKLAKMRHDVNNHLALIVAATELAQLSPEMGRKMLSSILEQPSKISADVNHFIAEYEKILGVVRPSGNPFSSR